MRLTGRVEKLCVMAGLFLFIAAPPGTVLYNKRDINASLKLAPMRRSLGTR